MKPSELDPERWRKIDRILERALDAPPREREAFLARVCAGDDELRVEVEALLEADRRAGEQFETPVTPLDPEAGPAQSALAEDRQVGPFRLVREIGRGGMGVVYEAEDTRLGRPVALKMLPPHVRLNEEAKQRFVSEARAVSALDHANIATLYEIDETGDGQLYMAFALYRGETLAERISRGKAPLDEAIEIACRIADGLTAAHERGIVHRDVKPSNVLLTEAGEIKLLDFGVAKMTGDEHTRVGAGPGTVAYMSPEQAGGGQVDHRSDLWSLGVVLYELLTGNRPFDGGDHSSAIRAILDVEPAPPSTHREELPQVLERIVLRLLSKEPERRYESAADLASDLRAVQRGEALPEVRPLRPARRRWIALGLAMATLTGIALIVFNGAWTTGEPIERLAVLPLENRGGNLEQQYFVDGVHEALIAELGKVGVIGVVSRTSMARYRDTEMSISEIANELDVDAVVEGSVLREGDSLTITTRLVQASPERLLWSETYRRSVESVLDVASEVAKTIATEVEVTMSPEAELRLSSPRSVDARAYDAYLRGWFHWERRSREGTNLARNYFRRAIGIDSTFAPAYAGLAYTYTQAADWVLEEPTEALSRARVLAETAKRIDDDLGEAYAALARVEFLQSWDWEESERLSRRALERNPSDTRALRTLAAALGRQGRVTEARAVHDRANELERMSPDLGIAFIAYFRRDFDTAVDHARAALEFDQGMWQPGWLVCMALAAQGAHLDAVAECEQVVEHFGRNAVALTGLGYAYALAGREEEALEVISELTESGDEMYVAPSLLAIVYGALGDRDRAFEWLDAAYEKRDPLLLKARTPLFEPLHPDPRFDEVLRRVGLEPVPSEPPPSAR